MLYLKCNVDLQLILDPLQSTTEARTFTIAGPDIAKACVKRESESKEGCISPLAKITLPRKVKIAAGIPVEAKHFAHLYPLEGLAGKHARLLQEPSLGGQTWLEALLFGAFVYFDAGGDVIRINALTLATSDLTASRLYLEGPFDVNPAFFESLEIADRIKNVTMDDLQDAELRYMAWVNPGELIDGQGLGDDKVASWEHGAIVFQCGDEPREKNIYFRIALGPSSRSGPGSFMDLALQSMRDSMLEAEEARQQMEQELALFRMSGPEAWIKQHSLRLLMYYVAGCYIYGSMEGWDWFDTVYYLTTTATTVGYGDIVPETPNGRLFTAIYAPLGCVYVVTAMMPIVSSILAALARGTSPTSIALQKLVDGISSCCWHLLTACRCCCRYCCCLWLFESRHARDVEEHRSRAARRLEEKRKAKSLAPAEVDAQGNVVMNTQAQYINVLVGPILLLIATALLAYYGFHDDLPSSIYFSVITMTTVGYGDLAPTNWHSKLALIFMMPIATAALTSAVSEAHKIAIRDAIRNAKFHLVIDELLLQETNGDPDRQLNKADFIMATLKAYDLVDEETLKIIANGFKEVSVDEGDGKDPSSNAADSAGKAGSKKPGGRKGGTLGCKQVYSQLVTQKRIHHVSKGTSQSQSDLKLPAGIVGVDLSAADGGFQQWYDQVWIPEVFKRAGKRYDPAPKAVRLPPPKSGLAPMAKAYKPVAPNAVRKGNPFIFSPDSVGDGDDLGA